MQALDLNRILLAIHRYFSSMTSQEIKARGLQEDKPLRMAKTLLHKICGLAVRHWSMHAMLGSSVSWGPHNQDSLSGADICKHGTSLHPNSPEG